MKECEIRFNVPSFARRSLIADINNQIRVNNLDAQIPDSEEDAQKALRDLDVPLVIAGSLAALGKLLQFASEWIKSKRIIIEVTDSQGNHYRLEGNAQDAQQIKELTDCVQKQQSLGASQIPVNDRKELGDGK